MEFFSSLKGTFMLIYSGRKTRIDFQHCDIPTKANRILYFILIAMLLIVIRLWHLSVIQYDQRLEESQKPQRRAVIEPAARATIRDRFNLPLAINKMAYQATILYSQLRGIPIFTWQKDEKGKRTKIFKRKEYIHQLAQLLAQELQLDAERIEDLIHAKASYYFQVPFIIKDNLSEQEYYRLKILEKDWPGLHVRHQPKRHYPKARVAADIIGYMGSINRTEYEKILHEMKALEQFIQAREKGEETELLTDIQDTHQARRRLKDLEAKAYTIHDYIGKTGIEGVYEKQLRGFYGKKNFSVDSKGNFLRELPGSYFPLAGHRILLTLSAELQEYAEQLLAQNEELRIVRKSKLGPNKHTVMAQKQPWIKGGAIIVMDPNTAEILTLASYPRFDPNDFILVGDTEQQHKKKTRIHRWFESETYLAQLWNQQQPLERERYSVHKQIFYDEECFLTWKKYLNFILPTEGKLKEAVEGVKTIAQAVEIQRHVESLFTLFPKYDLYSLFNQLYVCNAHEPHRQILKEIEKQELMVSMQSKQKVVDKIKKQLTPYFKELPHNYDKVLLVDLCRLAVAGDRFSESLLQKVGKESLENYHNQTSSLVTLLALIKKVAKNLYHDIDFKIWRQREEKVFLQRKRLEEKLSKTYPKPYIDYLDQQENIFFQEFWTAHCWNFLCAFLKLKPSNPIVITPVIEDLSPYLSYFYDLHQQLQKNDQNKKSIEAYDCLQRTLKEMPYDLAIDYLKTMRPYEELNRPLLGNYRLCLGKALLEKHLAAAFYPSYGFGYGRSHAYRQASIQGSLFKLVTAYEALVQRFHKIGKMVVSLQDLNPLTMIDEVHQRGGNCYVGYTEDGKPIPQVYKGGRLPRSLAHKHNGRVDLLRAIEVSSNPYFALLAGEHLGHPDDLSKAAQLFAYGSRTGIDLPGEIAGKVPKDLSTNRTGLYSMAIGQHSLVVTPLQTALMLATIANGGKVLKPKLTKLTVGQQPSREEQIICLPRFPYQEALALVGIDFPLFSAALHTNQKSLVKIVPTEVRREIFMPDIIRYILLRGLQAATQRTHQESLSSLVRLYRQYPEATHHFTELKDQLFGKTSTSESVENIDLDLQEGTNIYTHVWFGSIAFQDKQKDKNRAILLYKDEFGQPELVVVVYLRYGGYGKEAAPLAAQIVKKWREIKQKYAKT